MANGKFEVMVVDNWSLRDDGYTAEFVTGFKSELDAIEYARRRTRSSLEESRSFGDAEAIKDRWFSFGEACSILEAGYRGADEIMFFIANPAQEGECDWQAIEPKQG